MLTDLQATCWDRNMADSLSIAQSVLPHLLEHVARGPQWIRSYGFYAERIGMKAEQGGLAIGMAMHTIGAACVLAKVPVIPIHYVERADGEWRGIFESEYAEKCYVLSHWNLLATSSRVHVYTEANLGSVAKALNTVIPAHLQSLSTPKQLWRFLIYNESSHGVTWLHRALPAYEASIELARTRKNAP